MTLATFGINHQTADLDLREQIAFTRDSLSAALKDLAALPNVDGALILSTCNRTELYLSHQGLPETDSILDWLCRWHQIDREILNGIWYQHVGDATLRHAIHVASGLDSMVLGEPEILGQFKQAWRDAHEAGALDSELQQLAQHTFAAAKKVRSGTEISRHPVSLAHAAVGLTRQFFDDLEERRALVIGAGDTARLATRYLKAHQVGHLTIASRTLERAQALAQELLAYAIPISHMEHALRDADIVISCTDSPLPVLGKGTVEEALRCRKHQPIYMVDLAVPRDIEPQVGQLADAYLYTLDDLRQIVEKNMQSREQARQEAAEIIEAYVEEYAQRTLDESAFTLIRDYRAQAQQMRDDTLAQAQQRLQRGDSAAETLQWLAHTLSNRMMHPATRSLNEAGQNRDNALLRAARTLFRIDPPQS